MLDDLFVFAGLLADNGPNAYVSDRSALDDQLPCFLMMRLQRLLASPWSSASSLSIFVNLDVELALVCDVGKLIDVGADLAEFSQILRGELLPLVVARAFLQRRFYAEEREPDIGTDFKIGPGGVRSDFFIFVSVVDAVA